MNYYLLLAGCGLLCGVAHMLLRAGSGTVAVPLVYCGLMTLYAPGSAAQGVAMHVAVATSACLLPLTGLAACRLRGDRWHPGAAWPLLLVAGAGAMAGALLALDCGEFQLRLLYVLYLSILLCMAAVRLDRLDRLSAAHAILAVRLPRSLPAPVVLALTATAGWMASVIGVGGGAMTVPLMRRRGHDLPSATAWGCLLGAAVGAGGAMVYLTAPRPPGLAAWHIGYVDTSALATLACTALLGMRLAAPWAARLPERWRVAASMALMLAVLFKMTT